MLRENKKQLDDCKQSSKERFTVRSTLNKVYETRHTKVNNDFSQNYTTVFLS
jgi:hypothetical protein